MEIAEDVQDGALQRSFASDVNHIQRVCNTLMPDLKSKTHELMLKYVELGFFQLIDASFKDLKMDINNDRHLDWCKSTFFTPNQCASSQYYFAISETILEIIKNYPRGLIRQKEEEIIRICLEDFDINPLIQKIFRKESWKYHIASLYFHLKTTVSDSSSVQLSKEFLICVLEICLNEKDNLCQKQHMLYFSSTEQKKRLKQIIIVLLRKTLQNCNFQNSAEVYLGKEFTLIEVISIEISIMLPHLHIRSFLHKKLNIKIDKQFNMIVSKMSPRRLEFLTLILDSTYSLQKNHDLNYFLLFSFEKHLFSPSIVDETDAVFKIVQSREFLCFLIKKIEKIDSSKRCNKE